MEVINERMTTDRSFWRYFWRSLISFGIYDFFYYHRIVKDVNTMCEEDGKKSPGVLTWFLLSFVTCGIYNMLWWCNMHDRMRATAKRYGSSIEQTTSGLMLLHIGAYFLWGILSLVAMYKFINSMNELAVVYNRHNGHLT